MIFKEQADVPYQEMVPMQMPRMNWSQRAALKWATIEEYDRVLDMNCGNGAMLRHLSDRYHLDICGLSESPNEARAVRDFLGEADIVYAMADDIPFRSASFDEVFVTSHLSRNSTPEALKEISRVLRPGGQVVLACRTLKILSSFTGNDGEADIDRRSLMRSLQQAGFKDVSWRNAGLAGVVIGWKAENLK